MLTLFINRAKANDQVHGVVSHLIEDGLSMLYADDTILFMDHSLEEAQNMLSSLKINFHKKVKFSALVKVRTTKSLVATHATSQSDM